MSPGIGWAEMVIIFGMGLVMFGLIPVCCWQIVRKTGYPAWWSLGFFIPVVNIALLIMLAFSEWPALRGHSAGE
jgi:hypothetical protein